MPKPAPPRPGRQPVTEINLEPTPTSPPPRDPRPPPVELAGPRKPLPSIRDQTLAELAEEAREAKAEAEALRAALAAKAAAAPPVPSQAPPTRAQWQTAGFRALVSLGAVLTALATYLGVRSTTLEPKIDRTATKQEQQETKAGTAEDRILALEKYNRARAAWERCMNAMRDSAIERGTGHKVDSSHDDVQWVEQSAPKAVPRVLWKTTPWSISKDQSGCGAEPATPSAPPAPLP